MNKFMYFNFMYDLMQICFHCGSILDHLIYNKKEMQPFPKFADVDVYIFF